MKKGYQILGLIILLLCSIIYDFQMPEQNTQEISVASSYVNLEGAFLVEGKYEYSGEKSLQDIVDEVGVDDDANLDALSLEEKVVDESTIYLPEICSDSVSLNHASKEELMTLDRVGEKTAQKIIDYRQIQPFLFIEGIMNVQGIGEKTYLRLRERLCL